MRHIVALAIAIALLRSVSANAEGVQIALLNGDQFGDWKCGSAAPAEASQPKPDCGVAKSGETSSCPTLVITNGSGQKVTVVIQLGGLGFEEPPNHWGGIFDFGGPSCDERTMEPCEKGLAPGQSCYQNLDFSPERSGLRHGALEVLVTGGNTSTSKSYDLTGVGEYPPELQAIDAAIQRHEAELLRIPHVVRVSISDSGDNAIQIEVTHEADIAKVESQVPSKLDGFPVEVIEKIERVWAL